MRPPLGQQLKCGNHEFVGCVVDLLKPRLDERQLGLTNRVKSTTLTLYNSRVIFPVARTI